MACSDCEGPIHVLGQSGTGDTEREGEGEGDAEKLQPLLVDGGHGVLAGSITLTTFISPVARMREAPSFSWMTLARRRFMSTSEERRRYSNSSFDNPVRFFRRPAICSRKAASWPTERCHRGIQGRDHLRESLPVLRGHGAAGEIGGGRVLHRIPELTLYLGDLLAEEVEREDGRR